MKGMTTMHSTTHARARPWPRRTAVALLAVVLAAACRRALPPLVERAAGPPPTTVIRNVAIFDGLAAERTPACDVRIEHGRIVRIAAAGTIAATSGTRVIDGIGQTLLPGLIDSHGHVGNSPAPSWTGEWPDAKRNLQSYLYCGVTTVLDPADMATDAFTRRDAVARGELLGPRIYAAGPMFTTPGGHPVAAIRSLLPWWLRWYVVPRMTREVSTPDGARAAVAKLAPSHPDVLKVTVDAVPLAGPILAPDVLRALVDEARTHGIRVVAHVGTTADALEAADAGVAAWMHGVYKERIPDDMVPRLAAAHIPEVATINVFDSYGDLYEGKREATELERETAPARVLDAFVPTPVQATPPEYVGFFALLAATREARRDNVRRMHAAGVTILAGSDTQMGVFPGPGLHRELAKLVEAGLTPAAALRAATGDAARFVTGSDDPEFGTVAEGKIADLVLVDGDPTADITRTTRITHVLLGGVELARHPLPH
jgi:imidazolonepropionase-like amidohydrolase